MTDRELLELAAKAAGVKIDTHYVDGGASVWAGEPHNSDWTPDWNPLTDDGDALRLAVKLHLCADLFDDEIRVQYLSNGNEHDQVSECVSDWEDAYAATRRAIVRAAAEIGRKMK